MSVQSSQNRKKVYPQHRKSFSPYRNWPSAKCPGCGRRVWRPPSLLRINRFCSGSCASIRRNKILKDGGWKCPKRSASTRRRMSLAQKKCSVMRGKCFEKHPGWKGGMYINSDGYILRYMGKGFYKMEHRLVIEASLSRPLKEDEVVHHKNGVRSDNRLKNLELMMRGQHSRHHHAMKRKK